MESSVQSKTQAASCGVCSTTSECATVSVNSGIPTVANTHSGNDDTFDDHSRSLSFGTLDTVLGRQIEVYGARVATVGRQEVDDESNSNGEFVEISWQEGQTETSKPEIEKESRKNFIQRLWNSTTKLKKRCNIRFRSTREKECPPDLSEESISPLGNSACSVFREPMYVQVVVEDNQGTTLQDEMRVSGQDTTITKSKTHTRKVRTACPSKTITSPHGCRNEGNLYDQDGHSSINEDTLGDNTKASSVPFRRWQDYEDDDDIRRVFVTNRGAQEMLNIVDKKIEEAENAADQFMDSSIALLSKTCGSIGVDPCDQTNDNVCVHVTSMSRMLLSTDSQSSSVSSAMV